MTFLPIVDRELRVAARRPATFRNRWLAAAIVAAGGLAMMLAGQLTFGLRIAGSFAFKSLAGVALAFCILEGARITADCLSSEKRGGTLGLLFLTDLTGFDVVLGKLAATSLNSFYGLMAVLPVLALPVLTGGVTSGEYWRVVLALLNILFFSLCLGMFFSSLARSDQLASGLAIVATAFIVLLPQFSPTPAAASSLGWADSPLAWLSPGYPYRAAFTYVGNQPVGFWISLVLTQLLGWGLLMCSALVVPHTWQDPAPGRRRWWRHGKTDRPLNDARRQKLRKLISDTNPVVWLVAREQARPAITYVLVAIAALLAVCFVLSFSSFLYLISYAIGVILLNLVFQVWVAIQACHFLTEARRNGTLEPLLSTPLTVNRIIKAQVLAMNRLFLLPATVILRIEWAGLLLGLAFAPGELTDKLMGALEAISVAIGYMFCLGLNYFAISWVGAWFAVSSRNKGQAVIKTVLVTIGLPTFCLIIPFCGVVLLPLWPIALVFWADSKLEWRIRPLATGEGLPRRSLNLIGGPRERAQS
jgi:ABC-type transport system involved in multi-copper enzyme maturation permease subunit